MKTYRNEQYGFVIQIPEEWSFHSLGKDHSLIFKCRPNEAFNIHIDHLKSEPALEEVENKVQQEAQKKGCMFLRLGRVVARGKQHVWVRYYLGGGLWTKRYIIVLNEVEYTITATCLDEKLLLEMERGWDAVAASFCIASERVDIQNQLPVPGDEAREEPGITKVAKEEVLSAAEIEGVKTYRNESLGIEIDVPARWALPAKDPHLTTSGAEIIFGCGQNEAFYILVQESRARLSIEQIKLNFKRYALEKGYTNLEFGKFVLVEDEFVWAKYCMGDHVWVKKYFIFLDCIHYEVTASCTDLDGTRNLFDQKCKEWDLIVQLMHIQRISDDIHLSQSDDQTSSLHDVDSLKGVRKSENQKTAPGMKIYRNEKHGFEIDVPDGWTPPPAEVYDFMNFIDPLPPGPKKDFFQYGCDVEAFNFEIAPLFPEPLLKDTEVEFKLFARDRGFTDLHFGRISVGGKEHVCARYFVNDYMGIRWNKKYMIVLGGVEYAITGTCNDPRWFARREKDWDAIIQTFRLLKPVDNSANLTYRADRYREQRREVVQERIQMRDALGDLYARAYEAVAMGRLKEGRDLLEKCIQENPEHVLAHKEMAVVLEKLGDHKGAIAHRKVVERLDPTDEINRSKLERLLSGRDGMPESPEKNIPIPPVGGLHYGNPVSQPFPQDTRVSVAHKEDTLAFSIGSYLLIAALSLLYIQYKAGLQSLLTSSWAAHESLSNSEFNFLVIILFLGIGALVCLGFLWGTASIGKNATGESFFAFIYRTMQLGTNKKEEILGARVFSDFTRGSNGFLDALNLQLRSLIHSLAKIIMIPFQIGQVNRVMLLIFVLWLFLSTFILDRTLPVVWQAIYVTILYYFCYRALLFFVARLKGVPRSSDVMQPANIIAGPSLASFRQSTGTKGITPDLVHEILHQKSIVEAIQNDLRKTDKVGYKEVWRLGLITPDQDLFDPGSDSGSRMAGIKRYIRDSNFKYQVLEQIPVKRTAVLHSTGYFNVQLNNILISNGIYKHGPYQGGSYRLHASLNPGEFIRLRAIQVETNDSVTENRSPELARFLYEDGFPLKANYPDGDPLTTERGGVIVVDQGKVLIAYPKYLTQRRLIDNEGNLVDLGIDEGYSLGGVIEVKMRPAVLDSLVKYAEANKYTSLLRYHSIPYASDFMIPLLDTPISISGWADLFIDSRGKGKLFITREKTLSEWYEMMSRLKQLFEAELARKDHHVLGLIKDKTHLNYYLSRKMEILKEYYIIEDWNFV